MPALPIRPSTLLLVSKDGRVHNTFLTEETSTVDLTLVKEGTFEGQPAFLVFFEIDLASTTIKHFTFDVQFTYQKEVEAPIVTDTSADNAGGSPTHQTLLSRISQIWSGTFSQAGKKTNPTSYAKSTDQPQIVAYAPTDLEGPFTGTAAERERETTVDPDVGGHGIKLHLLGRRRRGLDIFSASPGMFGGSIAVRSRWNNLRVTTKSAEVHGFGVPRRFQVGVIVRHTAPLLVKLKYVRQGPRDFLKPVHFYPKAIIDNSTGSYREDSTTCNYTRFGGQCTKNCGNFDEAHMGLKVWKRRVMSGGFLSAFERKANDGRWVTYVKI